MQCRQFRNQHVAFVDDLLSAVDMRAMRDHVAECEDCAKRDVMIRRSLLVVRNMPTIEPSPDFMLRLNARLRATRAEEASRLRWRSARPMGWPNARALAAAAAIVAIAVAAYSAGWSRKGISSPRIAAAGFAPSVVRQQSASSALRTDVGTVSDAAVLATVPATVPVWSAMLTVGQMPGQFASVGFADGLTR